MKKSRLVRLIESLTEDAKSISDLSNLALVVHEDFGETRFILYDPAKFLEAVEEAKGSSISWGVLNLADSIIGYINVGESYPKGGSYGAKTVGYAAAKKKYGPIMYDIAMSFSNGLVPDRSTPSAQAQTVWKHYFDKRSDVEKKPLDNYRSPRTEPKSDDAEIIEPSSEDNFLNYAYFSKGSVDVSSLVANSKKAHERATEIYFAKPDATKSKPDFAGLLAVSAAHFFNKTMKSGN